MEVECEENELERILEKTDIEYMLEFETDIFINVVPKEQCALVIAAKGLNLDLVISNILKAYCDLGNLVLVLNTSEAEEKYFREKLNDNENVHTINSNIGTAERNDEYLSGGIHFVTTRILVVDMLKSRIPIDKITGIVVLRAHKIFESCQEAFVLRLFRQNNKTGFIKAFSNSPQSFTMGFCHVEKVMKALFVKGLFIWPRFHSLVIHNFKQHEPKVIELEVPISESVRKLQTLLLELMNLTVNQLKQANKTVELQEITVENCLTKKYHKILQAQLDLIWNQLGGRSKQLVADLKTLRHLLVSLFFSDPVTFYSYVMQYQTREYANSAHWVFFKPADLFFVQAKSIVFSGNREFNPEFCTKWEVLLDLLKVEIPHEIKKSNYKDSSVLILCEDLRTCHQLNQILTDGPHQYLLNLALRKKVKFNVLSREFKQSCKNVPEFSGVENKDESKPTTKKRLRKEESIESTSSNSSKDTQNDNDEEEDDEVFQSTYILTMSQTLLQNEESKTSDDMSSQDESLFEPFTQLENMNLTQICESLTKPKVLIQTFKSAENYVSLQHTLEVIKPNYVIFYHSNITAVREIEMYEAHRKSDTQLKIYSLTYIGTVEEQAYLTALRREKEAFEFLIETKATMVIPEDQDGKSDHSLALQREEEPAVKNTRKGGQVEVQTKRTIIVDMREFRSDLPHLIYRRGINIEPATISVGDYILTPDICVERKSLSDLIGSLNSGRLYQQCTQMLRFYAKPMLLIEFDINRSFGFQNRYVMSDSDENYEVQQKLLLLTIHFPKLKIIWTHGPYATAQLFEELKQGKDEPKLVEAMAIGGDEQDLDTIESKYNTNIFDFIQKLPGITTKNILYFMKNGRNLSEVLGKSEDELKSLVGNSSDAKRLYSALHGECNKKEEANEKGKSRKGAYSKFRNFRGGKR